MANKVESAQIEISQSLRLHFSELAVGRIGNSRIGFTEATLILTAEPSADGTGWISKRASDGQAPALELLVPDARQLDAHGLPGRLYFPAWPIHHGRAKIRLDALEDQDLIDSIIRDFVLKFWEPLKKGTTVG